jgi:mRNA interferase RelE/StbE
MKILLTSTFKRISKKPHRKQIPLLEEAIQKIQMDPLIGNLKTADLSGIYVYKFHLLHQLILLAYTYDEASDVLTLLSFAPHENFYENLKKQISA